MGGLGVRFPVISENFPKAKVLIPAQMAVQCHVHIGHGGLCVGGSRRRSVQPPHLHLYQTVKPE